MATHRDGPAAIAKALGISRTSVYWVVGGEVPEKLNGAVVSVATAASRPKVGRSGRPRNAAHGLPRPGKPYGTGVECRTGYGIGPPHLSARLLKEAGIAGYMLYGWGSGVRTREAREGAFSP